MGKVQTNFNSFIPGAISRSIDDVVQYYANVGTADIAFGDPVFYKAAAKGIVGHSDAAASANTFIGFAVRHPSQTPEEYGSNEAVYQPGDMVSVLVRGSICVNIVAAATVGAPVYMDANGKITGTSASTTAIPNAVFRTVAYPKAEIAVTKRTMS